MRTFTQKQRSTQQTTPANSAMRHQEHSWYNSGLHLQRTIGNQAVQRLPQSNATKLRAESSTTALARFGHDLSRIPVQATAYTSMQPKLKVSNPADQYEQEADRVADAVTRMPGGLSGDSSETPSIKSRLGYDFSQVRVHSATPSSTSAAPYVETGLWRAMGRQEGRPLQDSVRRHYEPAYGQSFGSVRIHTGPLARLISTSLRADGVTDGRNIALRRSEFASAGTTSPRVLAHELAHVQQQQGQPGQVLYRIPWTVDEGHYYPDRGGAVARARELQQTYMSIEIFQREDHNWQVRYRYGVPQPDSYPAVDTGLYYADQAGAERRASHLRTYGFVVEVFQRPDDNWQCRLLRLQGASPALPTSTGPDAGFYYTARASAERRAEALREAGFTVSVVERDDGNFQANISALPTYPDSGAAAEHHEPAAEAAEPAGGEAQHEGEVAEGEPAEGGAADINERVASFVADMNTALTGLRTARLTELRDAAPDAAAAEAITLPTIRVSIARADVRTPQNQASRLVGPNPSSWTCRSAHMVGNARHANLLIDDAYVPNPQAAITNHFGHDFYDDFVEAWNQAMADNDLRNYEEGEGWALSDAYHLEMPVRNVPRHMVDECIAEYVHLTREEGEARNDRIEDNYHDQIQALEDEE